MEGDDPRRRHGVEAGGQKLEGVLEVGDYAVVRPGPGGVVVSEDEEGVDEELGVDAQDGVEPVVGRGVQDPEVLAELHLWLSEVSGGCREAGTGRSRG